MSDLHMPGLESFVLAWATRGWLALLAFTAAVLVVAVLRKPCRQWFGTERAFQLWLLPPLAVLASQLPHAATKHAPLPTLVYAITSAVAAPLSSADSVSNFDWRVAAVLLWLIGVVAVLTYTITTQQRYRKRLRGATPLPAVLRWPVLRATHADVGPALVGAWRSRIVLPADFMERYDAVEQTLILAHESAHARRGDGWWSLLAHALVALLWFHPLAWWALAALRHDQELACDAAVLREHGTQRRNYANAMLKTQSAALALPVGCTWSPRHPLTERIAMLKQKPISSRRRRASSMALAALIGGMAGIAYASTAPVVAAHGNAVATAVDYALALDVSFDGNAASQHFKLCLKPGKYAHVGHVKDEATDEPTWSGRIAVLPVEEKGQIEIRADLSGGPLDKKGVHPFVRTMPGQPATIKIGSIDEKSGSFKGIQLVMTADVGC